MQASNKWLLLADPEAGTLVSWSSLRLPQELILCMCVGHMLVLIPTRDDLLH